MEPITAAETQLMKAAHRKDFCDFRTDTESVTDWVPTTKDAATWGDARAVRGAFLRHLVVDRGLTVDLGGARIEGDLNLHHEVVTIGLICCVLTGDAGFDGTTFTGDAGFDGTTFTGDAGFDGTTFTGDAGFDRSTFIDDARFNEATFTSIARFDKATFTGDARFDRATFTSIARFDKTRFNGFAGFYGATFTSDARFDRARFTSAVGFDRAMFSSTAGFDKATFTSDARFNEAEFIGIARFNEATFTNTARFNEAKFIGIARFDKATFTNTARFSGATFTSDARFNGATFTSDGRFDRANFISDARFGEAIFGVLSLSSVVWGGTIGFEGLRAAEVRLDGSVFREAVRVDVTAGTVSAVRLRAEKRLHLVVAGARVDFSDADLAPDSLIEAAPMPAAQGLASNWVEPVRRAWMDTVEWLDFQLAHLRLNRALTKALPAGAAASITSLRRARVASTTIAGMSLRDCSFSEVHGLDGLHLGDVQVLRFSQEKDAGWAWPRWLRSQRRLIVDELDVRGVATTMSPGTGPPQIRPPQDPLPTARAAAGAYRAMRKGLEDSKDEPGAADFYYGEMEMRRHAAGRWSVERALLTLYWLISGYGLRAWRALTCLAAVIGMAGWCFTNGDWVRPALLTSATSTSSATPLVDPDSAAWPWLFAGGETIALLRPTGVAGVTLVGFGTGVDLAVRVLGPVLLALALLAIRNRAKR